MQSNKYVSGNFFCRALPYCITFYIFSKTYYKKSRKPNAEFWSNLHKSGESEEVHQFLHPRCFCCISLISLLYFYYSEKDESKFLERFTVESTEQKEFVFGVLLTLRIQSECGKIRFWKVQIQTLLSQWRQLLLVNCASIFYSRFVWKNNHLISLLSSK